MCTLRFAIIAWLTLCGCALAQSPIPSFPPGTFQNRAALDASAASPPTINFVSTVIPTGVGTATISTASANLGSLFTNRRLVVIVAGGIFGRTISSGTIGSSSIDFSGAGSSLADNDNFWWMTAAENTGTTGQTVSVTYNTTQFGAPVFGIFSVDETTLLSKTPVVSCASVDPAATTGSATVATLAGGSIISGIFTSVGTTAGTISTSTAGLSTDAANINGSAGYGHANGTAANGASNVTWTWSTSSKAGICNFAFR